MVLFGVALRVSSVVAIEFPSYFDMTIPSPQGMNGEKRSSVYYTECKPKNKNGGGLGMRLHSVQCGKTGGRGGVIKMAWEHLQVHNIGTTHTKD